MDPVVGSFISVDPLMPEIGKAPKKDKDGKIIGSKYSKLFSRITSDPQELNFYFYVRNNPLIYLDPDGKVLIVSGNTRFRYRIKRALVNIKTTSEGNRLYWLLKKSTNIHRIVDSNNGSYMDPKDNGNTEIGIDVGRNDSYSTLLGNKKISSIESSLIHEMKHAGDFEQTGYNKIFGAKGQDSAVEAENIWHKKAGESLRETFWDSIFPF